MADEELNLATAALAIAIVALFIALGQLVQQLFGTADGYRQCQNSVIGGWSRLVRLRFRWSAFRLEVRVTTPHLEIHPFYPKASEKKQLIALDGSVAAKKHTYTRKQSLNDDEDEGEDLVSWSSLLTALHEIQQIQLMDAGQTAQFISKKEIPTDLANLIGTTNSTPVYAQAAAVFSRPKTRSWDLMPPDVVRPLASTTLGDLICIAQRLGMEWADFVPREGRIRAEGPGQSLSATLIRGMGIVVEYNQESSSRTKDTREMFESLYVPSIAADKMSFGIIPGNPMLYTWDLRLRSESIDPDPDLIAQATVDILKGNKHVYAATKAIRDSPQQHNSGHWYPAFVDLMGLWSPWIPLQHSAINLTRSPMGLRVYTMGECFETRTVWHWILQDRQNTGVISSVQAQVLGFYNRWAQEDKERFSHYHWLETNSPAEMAMRDFFEEMHVATSSFFLEQIEKTKNHMYYVDLVGSYLAINSHSLRMANENLQNNRVRPMGEDLFDQTFKEQAFIYVENIPKIVKDVLDRSDENKFNKLDPQVLEDACWMLIMRMTCWEMGVNRQTGGNNCVPSSYYKSPTRVYIL